MQEKYALIASKNTPFDTYWMTDIIRLFQHVLIDNGADVDLHLDELLMPEELCSTRKNIVFLFQHQYTPIPGRDWEKGPLVLVSIWNTAGVDKLPAFKESVQTSTLFKQAEKILTFIPEERDLLVAEGYNAILIDHGYHPVFKCPFPKLKPYYDCVVYGHGSPWQHGVFSRLKRHGLLCRSVFDLCHTQRDGAFSRSKSVLFLSTSSEKSFLSPHLISSALYHHKASFSLHCESHNEGLRSYSDETSLVRALKQWRSNSHRLLDDWGEQHYLGFTEQKMADCLLPVLDLKVGS